MEYLCIIQTKFKKSIAFTYFSLPIVETYLREEGGCFE